MIPMLQLINEPLAISIDQQSSHAPQCFRSEELDFCIRVFRVHEPSWVDLDFFKVNAFGTDKHGHFVAVASAVVAICCWLCGRKAWGCQRNLSTRSRKGERKKMQETYEVVILWSMLLE